MSSDSTSQKKDWYKTWWGIILFIIFLPITLIWFTWQKTKWDNVFKITATIVIAFLALLIVLGDWGNSSVNTNTSNQNENVVSSEQDNTVDENLEYTTLETEDVSFAGAVRYSLRVLIPYPTSENMIKKVAEKIVADEKSKEDYNAISISFYDRKEYSSGSYALAQAEYAPNGDWAAAGTVKTGDYSKHEMNYKFRPQVSDPEKYADKRPTDEESKLCEAFSAISEADNYVSDEATRMQKTADQEAVSKDVVDAAVLKCFGWVNLYQ